MKAKLAMCPFLSFVPLVFLACPLFFLLLLPSMFYCLSLPHFVTLLLLFFFFTCIFLTSIVCFFLLWSSLPGLLVFPFAVFALSSSSSLAPRYPDTVSSSLADNVFISKSVDVVNNSHFTYRPIVFCRKVKTFNQKQLFGLVGCI